MRPGVVGRLQATKGDRVTNELWLAFLAVVAAVVLWAAIIGGTILACAVFDKRKERKGKR